MDYVIRKEEHGEDGYFCLRWSPFARADKYEIVTRVPALGGVAELYYRDREGKLNLFCLQRSWYGGLRSMLRERTDPVLEKDPHRLGILETWKDRIYYRYTCTESVADMKDVMYFFMKTYAPDSDLVEHSGRYRRIFLKELDTGKLVTI